MYRTVWQLAHYCALFNLVLRDLKVSNLLMTDKGCVKIGESSLLP